MNGPGDERPVEETQKPFEASSPSYGPQQVTVGATSPQATQNDDLSASATIAIQASWTGPLPPPSALAEYDRIVPDGAKRIFHQFEAEAEHRRNLERQDATTHRLDLIGGQVLVGVFILGAYVVTALAIAKGALWVAGIIGSLTTVLTIFFSARYGKRKEAATADDEQA